MKVFLRIFFLLGISAIFLWAQLDKKKLVFAPLPILKQKTVYETFKPLTTYLEKKLSIKVEFLFSSSYEDLLEKINSGKVDIFYLGPLPYVKLKSSYSAAKPLVSFKNTKGDTSYTCSIISWGKTLNPILKSYKIALTSPLSTCGKLAMSSFLSKRGEKLDDFYFDYLGRHDKVALSVVKGEYDLGGVKSSFFKKYEHLGLKEIAKSFSFPSLSLIADSSRLSDEDTNKLKEALLNISSEERKDWLGLTKYGCAEVSDSAYDELRSTMHRFGMLK